MSSTKMMSGIVALTTDTARIAMLRNKLAEYEARHHFPYQAPEVDPHATYKYRLLKALLDDGVLDVGAQEASFAQNDWHQPAAFRDATAVIEAYNAGELAMLSGGTGLK